MMCLLLLFRRCGIELDGVESKWMRWPPYRSVADWSVTSTFTPQPCTHFRGRHATSFHRFVSRLPGLRWLQADTSVIPESESLEILGTTGSYRLSKMLSRSNNSEALHFPSHFDRRHPEQAMTG